MPNGFDSVQSIAEIVAKYWHAVVDKDVAAIVALFAEKPSGASIRSR